MTTIKTARHPLEGKTAAGRPVRFSLAAWGWYYIDTPASAPVEKVYGQIRVVR